MCASYRMGACGGAPKGAPCRRRKCADTVSLETCRAFDPTSEVQITIRVLLALRQLADATPVDFETVELFHTFTYLYIIPRLDPLPMPRLRMTLSS